MAKFTKLVRFLASDGKVYYGDAIGSGDARFAKYANIIEGDIFGSHTVTDKVIGIRKLLCPLAPTDISSIRCIGLNYSKHAVETNMPKPKSPILFYKPRGAAAGPTDPIVVPSMQQPPNCTVAAVDYECELVVVIGKECKDVTQSEALDYVLGYSVANDVSQRDWQIKLGGGQWSVGKMCDGWAPFGPAIVPTSVIPDPQTLTIYTKVNGKLMQKENTSDMIFNVAQAISFFSQGTTLYPGDIILTGTPSGVASGFKNPPWLKHGDVVEIGLEKVGTILNKVEYEPFAKFKL
ncbi:hypothetical protein CANCADRAFT_1416 [Tortispora caseinolytica NRRL Y-17796]|uniref:Fumarylacetoacetase-like C-terminal domain-containing protein n=1 Tax=Tortispora caseinolytica NRRL Y-17796 TaxID=767744 RepID=A0A1E4TM47_9ASCO|nr:hypothetical protein CANCADRAFT_1416 [Tortispora caseinolytica NRRL Y-17796]